MQFLQRGLALLRIVGEQHERRPSVDEIGHLWYAGGQRDSVQVGAEVQHLNGQVIASLAVVAAQGSNKPGARFWSPRLVCGEGLLQHMMGSPPSLCSLWEMGILQ